MATETSEGVPEWDNFPWSSFDFDEQLGGAVEVELDSLPEYFSPWEELGRDLDKLLQDKQLRDRVQELPVLEASRLQEQAEWHRAYVLLTHLTNGYIWQEGMPGKAKNVPAQLAQPLCCLADKVKMTVGGTYASAISWNWERLDKQSPAEIENMRAAFRFLGGEKYDWFVVMQIIIEGQVAQGVRAGLCGYKTAENADTEALAKALHDVADSLNSIVSSLRRIYEKVSPEDFFTGMLAYYGGWGGSGSDMVHFDGVEEQPDPCPGVNGSQAITLEVFDAILRIQRSEYTTSYQNERHKFIPAGHGRLVNMMWQGPSLKDYVLAHKEPALVDAYNAAVKALLEVRKEHMQIIVRYALNMQKKFMPDMVPSPQDGVHPFVVGPKAFRKATEEAYITLD